MVDSKQLALFAGASNTANAFPRHRKTNIRGSFRAAPFAFFSLAQFGTASKLLPKLGSNLEHFFIRFGPSSLELTGSAAIGYIREHFERRAG
jgi:hypothetical protein